MHSSYQHQPRVMEMDKFVKEVAGGVEEVEGIGRHLKEIIQGAIAQLPDVAQRLNQEILRFKIS